MTTNRVRLVHTSDVVEDTPESALLNIFPEAINPHADHVEAESLAWARRQGLCDTNVEYARLAKMRIGRLAARGFPRAGLEGLQVAADWTTLFCLLDDRIEVAAIDICQFGDYVSQLSTALRAGRSLGDPATNALVDLRNRITAIAGAAVTLKFADVLDKLFAAFMWEHLNRQNGLHPSLSSFAKMRATTVGLYPQFVLAAVTDGICLSDELLGDPSLRALMQHVCNIVGLTNDLFTFDRELAQGEVHNQVILLIHECGMSPQEARYAAVQQHNDNLRAFVACDKQLRDAKGEEFERQRFVGVLRSWIRGHLDWAYETGRYDIPLKTRFAAEI